MWLVDIISLEVFYSSYSIKPKNTNDKERFTVTVTYFI